MVELPPRRVTPPAPHTCLHLAYRAVPALLFLSLIKLPCPCLVSLSFSSQNSNSLSLCSPKHKSFPFFYLSCFKSFLILFLASSNPSSSFPVHLHASFAPQIPPPPPLPCSFSPPSSLPRLPLAPLVSFGASTKLLAKTHERDRGLIIPSRIFGVSFFRSVIISYLFLLERRPQCVLSRAPGRRDA